MSRDFRGYSVSTLSVALLCGAFLVLPVAFLCVYAFNPTQYFTLPITGLSLRWFHSFFENDRFLQAFGVSMKLGLIIIPIVLAISLPAAYALVRGRFPGRDFLNAVIMSPLVIPGVVTGIAFLIFLNKAGMGSGFTPLLIGMTCFTMPYAVRALVANMHGLRPELEEAALNLGAGKWSVFWYVILPQLRPGMLAGSIFVFVEAVDNFSVAVFLSSTNSTPLPVEAYSYIRDYDDPTIAAMSLLLMLISTGLMLLASRYVGLNRMFQVE
ncbi:ABC transporter permease [Bordetella sp. N]|uniref:ABC transporter permease n=1 Tax=Bordetella sp. N TaxID=1746199 RepID=UPI0007100868|nr:ABC transporter permease [Bordetella sp. N]ALM85987.1 hypothetical protein ASB57_26265 [Bordetella sp. N]